MIKSIRIDLFSFKTFGSIAIITLFLAQALSSFAALVKATTYDSSGQMLGYTTLEYNAAGQISKVSSYNASGQLTGYSTYEYNAAGQIFKVSSYNALGQLTGYSTYEYNAAGLRSKSSSYNASGQLGGYNTFEYNAAGLESKMSTYNASGQLTGYTTYEYNAAGLESKMSTYNASGQMAGYFISEYNASGLKSKSSSYNASGQLTGYHTYEYNASGLKSKDSAYNTSGQLLYYSVYEYSNETTVATPVFSPVPGTYTAAQSVTLSCTTAGATIRYTTDNTEPNASSTVYTSSIGVSTTTTIKAKAFKSGWTASATATGSYTLPPPGGGPVILVTDGSFGVRTNQFGFNITGSSNLVVVVEGCTILATPNWSPLATNTLTNASIYFSDPQWTNYPTRLYRLCAP